MTGGGGGGKGAAEGSSDVGNQFDDPTFLAIFVSSWVIIAAVLVAALILVVLSWHVKAVREFLTGKTSRERRMRKTKLGRMREGTSSSPPGSPRDLDSLISTEADVYANDGGV